MSLLDVLVLIIIGTSVVTGFIAGFARVGIGTLAAICGMLCAFWFYGIPAQWVHRFIQSETASNFIGFFLVFFFFLAAGALIGKAISKLFKWTGLSWLDRLMGGLFGFVRGSLITVAFIAILLAFTPKPMPNWMVDSKVLPYAIRGSDLLASLAPNSIKTAFRQSVAEIRRTWDEELRHARRQLHPLIPESDRSEQKKSDSKDSKKDSKSKKKSDVGRSYNF